MTTPEPTVIERIHRIGVDLSVLLELNDAATSRTPLVSEAIRALDDDDATTVLQLFSWDDTVCLRRARTVLADAVDRFDDRKRGVDGDPNPFASMVAVYHLACGCTVESGPGEPRLMVGQQWECPAGDGKRQRVESVTFSLPAKVDDEFAGKTASYRMSCGCSFITPANGPRFAIGQHHRCPHHLGATITGVSFSTDSMGGLLSALQSALADVTPGAVLVFDNTDLLAREEVTPSDPPTQ